MSNGRSPVRRAPGEPMLPENSAVPGDTAAPEQSIAPEESTVPEESTAPEESAAPENSTAPEESPLPEESASPETSGSPENSADPEVSESVGVDPVPPTPPFPWTGLWIGLGVAMAAAVVAAAAALWLRKKGKKGTKTPVEAISSGAGTIAVGKVHEQGARESQQDCFSVSPEELIPTNGLLAVVADGMGGLSAGDKVSQTAVTAMMNGFYVTQGDPAQVLLLLLEQANQAVNQLLGPGNYSKSGSTLVAGLIRDGKFHYVSVGDSRICLYRNGMLIQLNREHVFRNELTVRAMNGENSLQAAVSHPKAAGLTSYLGMGKLKYVDLPAQPVAVQPGDKFILMSDGVYNALSEQELSACLEGPVNEAADRVRQEVQAKGYQSQDNYTAVILGC